MVAWRRVSLYKGFEETFDTKYINSDILGGNVTKQLIKKEEIDKIINILKKYTKENFKFTEHYYLRIAQRDIKQDFLLETFFDFNSIKLVEQDIMKYGDVGYDLFYELSNNRTLIIGVIPKKQLIFTHGILRYRKWQSALKVKKPR